MRKKLRLLLAFCAGVFSGLLAAQCLIVLYAREGGNFGGEVFTLLALPLLLFFGFSMGLDSHRILQPLERIPVVHCRECQKAMRKACCLFSFDMNGFCTGGPDGDFYCADGIKNKEKLVNNVCCDELPF